MDFKDLLVERYSVRDYDERPIEEEKLQKILEAGRMAPTAVNFQPQRIFVLKSKEAVQKMRSVTRMAFNAPVILLVCYDKTVSWKADKYGDKYDVGEMDASIVTSLMMMQATELGIGSLWVRGYKTADIVEAFNLPENMVPVCLLLLGYASENDKAKRKNTSRLPLEETVKEI